MQKQMQKNIEALSIEGKSLIYLENIAEEYADALVQSSPDLKTNGLAMQYSLPLFQRLVGNNPLNQENILNKGRELFYDIGKNLYGPLAVAFAESLLKNADSDTLLMFPQRDANIFYIAALAIKSGKPGSYAIPLANIMNPVINRSIYGVEDEVEGKKAGMQNLFLSYLHSLGFGTGKKIVIADAGAWGTMIDALKKLMPEERIMANFFYSHMPEKIEGFANKHAGNINDSYLETINDFIEAFPKPYKRPELLVEHNGKIIPDYSGLQIDSKFISAWSNAAMHGIIAATQDFLNGHTIDISKELEKLCLLSDKARAGIFTGMLPSHTETWKHGEEWKKNWPWGQIECL
ncbi:MAG: hypothetical protein QXS03_01370 [Candidatus Micrarchaeaceae archaeon]